MNIIFSSRFTTRREKKNLVKRFFFTQLNIKWYFMNIFFCKHRKILFFFSLSHMKTNFCVDLLDKLVFTHKEKKLMKKNFHSLNT